MTWLVSCGLALRTTGNRRSKFSCLGLNQILFGVVPEQLISFPIWCTHELVSGLESHGFCYSQCFLAYNEMLCETSDVVVAYTFTLASFCFLPFLFEPFDEGLKLLDC
jgi:hypothetical protein